MAGTVVTPAPVPGIVSNSSFVGGGAPGISIKPSDVNSYRISAVIDRLHLHVRSHVESDAAEFLNLCLSLSRGIDFAIANNDVPSRAQELPSLLKQVWHCQKDAHLLGAIMVLMVSVKNACQSGWFSDRDSEELSCLVKEIANNFCSASNFNVQPSCSLSVISTIMSRFYPRMKLGHVFAFLDVKPGFDAYVSDFQISRNLKSSRGDKIRLFVVQTDSIETSSCLITPAKANFLLNGKGVERRNSLFMDTGPQIPTAVTHLLKYGSNLLQAVGEFSGNYIAAVAIMSEMPNPDSNAIQDYEEHAPATVDSDSELIVGASRISLNCPISFTRIKAPVKGHSCKHVQCFDFDNYLSINSRRPSWRCPHCNQHVCFTDIRIDQKMAKVLREVGTEVSNVIVSADGSWTTIRETDDATQNTKDKTIDTGEGESPQAMDVLDLTGTDDVMDGFVTNESGETKLPRADCQSESMTQATAVNPPIANINNVNQRSAGVDEDFWSGIYLSTFGLGSSNVASNEQIAGASFPASNYIESSHVLADSFSTALDASVSAHSSTYRLQSHIAMPQSHTSVPQCHTSAPQSHTPFPNTLQLQHYQFGNSAVANEYGRISHIPSHINRTPVAVQALPVQASSSGLPTFSRNSVNFLQDALAVASQASVATPTVPNFSQMSSSPSHQYPGMPQNQSYPYARASQQNVGLQASNQVPYVAPSQRSVGLQGSDQAPYVPPSQQNVGLQASNQVQYASRLGQSSTLPTADLRMPRPMNQSQGLQSSLQPSASHLQPRSQVSASQGRMVHTTGHGSGQQAHVMAPSYSMSPDVNQRPSTGDQRPHVGISSQPITSSDAQGPADQNWRPAGRMRGALSGQAYTDAFNRYIIQPNQQAQVPRSVSNVVSHLDNFPAQSFMASSATHVSPAPSHPSTGPASLPRFSNNLPS